MSENTLKPEQALAILEQATAQVTTNRQGHAQIIQALSVLKTLIEAQKTRPSQD